MGLSLVFCKSLRIKIFGVMKYPYYFGWYCIIIIKDYLGGAMDYELLKKEFSHLSSFLIWDDERVRNGLPPCFGDEKYREKNFKPSYIYLAMNLRTDDEDFYRLYNSFRGNAYNIFEKSELVPFWVFHNLEEGIFSKADPAITRFNNLFSDTKLEGAYVTDFFKTSPGGKFLDGFVTKDGEEVFSFLKSLDKKSYETYIKTQLKALDREIELLGVSDPKFLVINSIYDLVRNSFDKFLNEKDFPNLYRAKIVDVPPPYGAAIRKDVSELISLILKNIDDNLYPSFIIDSICKNYFIIESLREIANPAHTMAILYLSLNINFNLPKTTRSYLENIGSRYQSLIKMIKSCFSKDIILEIIKNFSYIFSKVSLSEVELSFYREILKAGKNCLIILDNDISKLSLLLKQNLLADSSFLVGDYEDFILLSLMKKSLSMPGFVFMKDDFSLRNLNFDRIIDLSGDLALCEKVLDENSFSEALLMMTYEDFMRERNLSFRKSIENKFPLFYLANFDNQKVFLKVGRREERLLYRYFDRNFSLFKEGYFDASIASEDHLAELNNIKDNSRIYRLKDFIIQARRGYSVAELLNLGLMYDCEGLSYVSNANIGKGFVSGPYSTFAGKINSLFYASEGDIIISKTYPYNTAIIDDDNKYLVNDNLFILRLDKNKVDPYYVLAFLESKKTKDLIKSKLKNSNNLSMKVLKSLEVEFYSIKKRETIRNNIIENLKNTKKAYENISEFEKDLRNIF